MSDVAVKIGDGVNRFVLVLKDYPHPARVDQRLLDAIVAALDRKFQGHGWKEFDYVEVLRYVDLSDETRAARGRDNYQPAHEGRAMSDDELKAALADADWEPDSDDDDHTQQKLLVSHVRTLARALEAERAKVAKFRRLAERVRDWYFARDLSQNIVDITEACAAALEETKQ
jgi:PAS domain-containing protein